MVWGYIIKKLLLFFLLPLFALGAQSRDKKPEAPVVYEADVTFQGFPWGTSVDEFTRKMGNPTSRENINGYTSLAWQNVFNNGYKTVMIAYFSRAGLQGGTYYFMTSDMEELVKCYGEVQRDIRDRFGPTPLYYNGSMREFRPYDSFWNLSRGCIHLKVNTRLGDPVTLWYYSPAMAKQLFGDIPAGTKG
jgi:hypothetical protein